MIDYYLYVLIAGIFCILIVILQRVHILVDAFKSLTNLTFNIADCLLSLTNTLKMLKEERENYEMEIKSIQAQIQEQERNRQG